MVDSDTHAAESIAAPPTIAAPVRFPDPTASELKVTMGGNGNALIWVNLAQTQSRWGSSPSADGSCALVLPEDGAHHGTSTPLT